MEEPSCDSAEGGQESQQAVYKDRFRVSGLPTDTSDDLLWNYVESVGDVPVALVTFNKARDSAIIYIAESQDQLDIPDIKKACLETPLDEKVPTLTVSGIPVSRSVLVSGLSVSTATNAIKFFFANKRRCQGGPVERVERSEDKTAALVHFKDSQDAVSVAQKEGHTLDGHVLQVTLHLGLESLTQFEGRPPQGPATGHEGGSEEGSRKDGSGGSCVGKVSQCYEQQKHSLPPPTSGLVDAPLAGKEADGCEPREANRGKSHYHGCSAPGLTKVTSCQAERSDGEGRTRGGESTEVGSCQWPENQQRGLSQQGLPRCPGSASPQTPNSSFSRKSVDSQQAVGEHQREMSNSTRLGAQHSSSRPHMGKMNCEDFKRHDEKRSSLKQDDDYLISHWTAHVEFDNASICRMKQHVEFTKAQLLSNLKPVKVNISYNVNNVIVECLDATVPPDFKIKVQNILQDVNKELQLASMERTQGQKLQESCEIPGRDSGLQRSHSERPKDPSPDRSATFNTQLGEKREESLEIPTRNSSLQRPQSERLNNPSPARSAAFSTQLGEKRQGSLEIDCNSSLQRAQSERLNNPSPARSAAFSTQLGEKRQGSLEIDCNSSLQRPQSERLNHPSPARSAVFSTQLGEKRQGSLEIPDCDFSLQRPQSERLNHPSPARSAAFSTQLGEKHQGSLEIIPTPSERLKDPSPARSAAAVMQKPLTEKCLPLQSHQFILMKKPGGLDLFRKTYTTLSIVLDEEKRKITLTGPEDDIRPASIEIMTYCSSIGKKKSLLTRAQVQFYTNPSTKQWIDKGLYDSKLEACHWEVDDNNLIIICKECDFSRIQSLIKDVMQKPLTEKCLPLQPQQFILIKKPGGLDLFRKTHTTLSIVLDEEKRRITLTGPEDDICPASIEIMTYCSSIGKKKSLLTRAQVQFYTNPSTKQWIDKGLYDSKLEACHWEVDDNNLIIICKECDFSRIQSLIKEVVFETEVKLEENELCLLKSDAWNQFTKKSQENCKTFPAPVFLREKDYNAIKIVDIMHNVMKTKAQIQAFFQENKRSEVSLDLNPNHIKFLRQYALKRLESICEHAGSVGVSVKLKSAAAVVQGPKGSVPGVVKKIRGLVDTVQEDRVPFKKAGAASYFTGAKGQEFLQQTGSVTNCLVSTEGSTASSRAEPVARVLAEVRLDSGCVLQIAQGDITQSEADAIVNAANSQLDHAGGVAAAIVKADEEDLLEETVAAVLKKAEELGVTSLAMPAISCGIFGFPVDRATAIMVQTIWTFFASERRQGSLKSLSLVDMSTRPLQGWLRAAATLFGKDLKIKGDVVPSRSKGGATASKQAEKDFQADKDSEGQDSAHLPIRIISGEIARSKADVIVCTVHPSLDLRKGVLSKTVLDRGGDSVQQELKRYREKHGAASLGSVVRTSGGSLRCKWLFSLSLPRWRDDQGQVMMAAVAECLQEASRLGATSIAFPTLGTGRMGYPPDQAASLMRSAIRQWLQGHADTSMKDIQIVVFSLESEILQAFKDAEKNRGGNSSSRGQSGKGKRSSADGAGGRSSLKMKVDRLGVMIKKGDILAEPCDALVNSSNDNLDLSKGALSVAISRACGPSIKTECTKQRQQMQQSGVVLTQVEGTDLSSGSIIHVSADRFGHNWTEGIKAVLRFADSNGLASLALPALGTGAKGADVPALVTAMHKAISAFAKVAQSLKEIRIVIFQESMLQAYIAAFDPKAGDEAMGESDVDAVATPSPGTDNKQHVDVYIYYDNRDACRDARQKIEKHFENIWKSQTETNPHIASFTAKQLEEVFRLQTKHNVSLVLEKRKGVVTVTGVDVDVALTVSDLKDILLSAAAGRQAAAGGPPVRWQYDVGHGKFADFDPEVTLTIEAAFKTKKPEVLFKDRRGREYKIVFRDRKEYCLSDRNAKPVSVNRRDLLQESKAEISTPKHWAPMVGKNVLLVDLKPDSTEYKKVAAQFGSGKSVKKIERVQNPSLYQQFKVKKKELEQQNPKGTENEKRLFHGTSADSITSIINNGFNRSYCGKNGTALGAGVYFAADSTVSMGYAQGGKMFQARVLVGEYTPGNSGMRMAPTKPNSVRPYDSVSNAPSAASVFVIFHDSQAYPEYLITF